MSNSNRKERKYIISILYTVICASDIYQTNLSSFSFVATAFVVDEMTVALHCDASMLFWQGLRTYKNQGFSQLHFQNNPLPRNKNYIKLLKSKQRNSAVCILTRLFKTKQTPPRCSSVPCPWHLQVKGVIPRPINSTPSFLFLKVFFPACIIIAYHNTAQYPKTTVKASVVADGR